MDVEKLLKNTMDITDLQLKNFGASESGCCNNYNLNH